MDIKFNIFISHDANDQAIALELKNFLEDIFLNFNVYVSGKDIQGGQTWIENIKLALKSSQVIIALVTKKSINANWLYFESGAGFTDDRTIPLISDNLQFKDLTPPLSLLHSRILDKEGVGLLVTDIVQKLNLRMPTNLPGVDEMIARIAGIIDTKEKAVIVAKPVAVASPQPVTAVVKKVDEKVLLAYVQLQQRAKSAIIKKLLSAADKYPIPSEAELQHMQVHQLCEVAKAYNIPIPSTTNLRILGASLGLPSDTDDDYKKQNVLRGFDQANSELDRYEAQL